MYLYNKRTSYLKYIGIKYFFLYLNYKYLAMKHILSTVIYIIFSISHFCQLHADIDISQRFLQVLKTVHVLHIKEKTLHLSPMYNTHTQLQLPYSDETIHWIFTHHRPLNTHVIHPC